jgi:hypothetical protein
VRHDFALRNRFRQEVFDYEEVVDRANIISQNVPVYLGINFHINELSSTSNFSNIYDSYRIRRVDVLFRAVCVQMVVSGSSSTDDSVQNIPEVYTAIDLDDSSAPTAIADLERYATMMQCLATSSFVRKFTPRYLTPIYNGLSSAYALGDPNVWLDLANSNIPHYALKFAMTPDSGANNNARFVYAVTIKYHVQFWRKR